MAALPENSLPASAPVAASGKSLIDLILDTIEDAKAEEVVTVDLTGKSSLADHMVVASGRSQRHVAAVADQVISALRDNGHGKPRVEGLPMPTGSSSMRAMSSSTSSAPKCASSTTSRRCGRPTSPPISTEAMRIAIAAVGRMKAGPERELVARYLDRATASGKPLALTGFDVAETSESRAGSAAARKIEEARALRALLPEGILVTLDERGKSLTSDAFARQLARWRDDGRPAVGFVIGGADGIDPISSRALISRSLFRPWSGRTSSCASCWPNSSTAPPRFWPAIPITGVSEQTITVR